MSEASTQSIGEPVDRNRHGVGESRAGALFRDPSGVEEEANALRLEIAKVLVRAPVLPVELPAFSLTLLSVATERNLIDLVIGKGEPLARLRIKRVPPTAATAGERPAAVSVDVLDVHADAQRFQPQLAAMAQRLRAAITAERWKRAIAVAKKLVELPAEVPLAFYRRLVAGAGGRGLVRTGFSRFGTAQILTWIEDLHAAGARELIISAGEPTLDDQLESYIRRARELGFATVTLETDAIPFTEPGLAERLRDAGLSDCTVSLHSGDAAASDLITGAPGTTGRTVDGIKALLAARVDVRLACTMTRKVLDQLEGVPDFMYDTFAGEPSLRGLMLSQPADLYDRSMLPTIAPEPERLRAVLRRVIDRCFDLGIAISGLDGPSGPPLCSFGADPRVAALAPVPGQLDGRTYLPACADCAVRFACFGVWVSDVELYGDASALPVEPR